MRCDIYNVYCHVYKSPSLVIPVEFLLKSIKNMWNEVKNIVVWKVVYSTHDIVEIHGVLFMTKGTLIPLFIGAQK